MTTIDKALRKMRRLWVLERSARAGLLIGAMGVLAVLLALLLIRIGIFSRASVLVAAGLTVLAVIVLALATAMRAPGRRELARLLDQRSASRDLFASALEFTSEPHRFGWLGELTCRKAMADAQSVALRPRLSVGPLRQWAWLGGAGGLLVAANIVTVAVTGAKPAGPPPRSQVAIGNDVAPASTRSNGESAAAPAAASTMEIIPVAPPTTQGAETVQITNEMMQQFMAPMANQDVDLTGVTPIRWDAEEVSGGKQNLKNSDDEKVDPVKLDAALLKDLQSAKKTKKEGGEGEKGGVDIAVMGEQGGMKTKADGGKNKEGSLADAASKDPRGQPTRMAVKPPRKGLQTLSAAKWPSRQRGEERPMSALEFLAALDALHKKPLGPDVASPVVSAMAEDAIVRQESLPPDAATLAESYFGQLRKADR
jgi:hypothetical protein